MNPIRLERFRAIVARIEADPSCWDQSTWHCGTAHCVAGHAQIDAGLPVCELTCAEEAMHWLGISVAQGIWLFSKKRTLEDLRWYADAGFIPEGGCFIACEDLGSDDPQ